MSVLRNQEEDAEIQIWNNAAFDDSEDSMAAKGSSWWSQSIESNCSSKENLNPDSISSTPFKGVKTANPLKPKQGILSSKTSIRDEKMIDMEIEEVESEIRRLSSRLEALRLEKVEKHLAERRARIVPAKFMEQKQSVKFDEPSGLKPRLGRRGVSLGPAEIASRARMMTTMNTPVSSTSNRRKSCFWKLDEIDELKVTKERGKSHSVSPRSRKTATKPQPPPKHAQTTVGSKRPVKKDDGVLSLIQPKTLFRDGEKSVKKAGRIVASRYNQTATNQRQSTEARKRSLPESDKEDGNKRRASRGNGLNQKTESAVKPKKKWEIPDKVLVFKGKAEEDEDDDAQSEEFQSSVSELITTGGLRKIRTNRPCSTVATPRNSGAAKRVADLVGKKSYFAIDEDNVAEAESSVCLALSFED
ncbi:hypothetical protein LINGRAHAP2_LOCUS28778 [Linum grandiflorum]